MRNLIVRHELKSVMKFMINKYIIKSSFEFFFRDNYVNNSIALNLIIAN